MPFCNWNWGSWTSKLYNLKSKENRTFCTNWRGKNASRICMVFSLLMRFNGKVEIKKHTPRLAKSNVSNLFNLEGYLLTNLHAYNCTCSYTCATSSIYDQLLYAVHEVPVFCLSTHNKAQKGRRNITCDRSENLSGNLLSLWVLVSLAVLYCIYKIRGWFIGHIYYSLPWM